MELKSKHPLLKLMPEFAELCKPLALFHITHFTYIELFNLGGRITLSNKPQWVEDYYNLNLYRSSLFEGKPSEYKGGYNVWTGEFDLPVYKYGREYYNTADCIAITQPNEHGCEHYLFSTTPDKPEVIQYLANNMDILYHFIAYMKDKGSKLLETARRHKIIIPSASELNSNIQSIGNININFEELNQAKAQFYKETQIKNYSFAFEKENIIFSKPELQCITHLLKNKTAEETANLIFRSRRTVETHLDNVRLKLRCQNKIELIQILKRDKFLANLGG